MRIIHQEKAAFVVIIVVCCVLGMASCKREATPETKTDVHDGQCLDINLSEPGSPSSILTIKKSKEKVQIDLYSEKKACINLTGSFDGGVVFNNQKNVDVDFNLNNVHITSNASAGYLSLKSNDGSKGNTYRLRLVGSSEIIGAPNKESNEVLYSKPNLVISGDGSLSVLAQYKTGIACDDILTVEGGSTQIKINRTEALAESNYNKKGFAIKVENGFVMTNGKLAIDANDNITNYESRGIKVDGSDKSAYGAGKGYIKISGGELDIHSDAKALSAGWEIEEDAKTEDVSDDPHPDVYISGGVVRIETRTEPRKDRPMGPPPEMRFDENGNPMMPPPPPGMRFDENGNPLPPPEFAQNGADGQPFKRRPSPNRRKEKKSTTSQTLSPEGIEAKRNLVISGGSVIVKATDDGLNAGELVEISGGEVYVWSTSNDAVDSNGKILISGGMTVLLGTTGPDGALDADRDENVSYTGGTLVALGGDNNAPKGDKTTKSFVSAAIIEDKMFGPPSFAEGGMPSGGSRPMNGQPAAGSEGQPAGAPGAGQPAGEGQPAPMQNRKAEKSELAASVIAVAEQDSGQMIAAIKVPETFTGGGSLLVLSDKIQDGKKYLIYTNPTLAQPISQWTNDVLSVEQINVTGENSIEAEGGKAPARRGPGMPPGVQGRPGRRGIGNDVANV